MGAVLILVEVVDCAVVIVEIPAVVVVYITVAVVVDAVDGVITVHPDALFKVGMGGHDAFIDHADSDIAAIQQFTPSQPGLTGSGTEGASRLGIFSVHAPGIAVAVMFVVGKIRWPVFFTLDVTLLDFKLMEMPVRFGVFVLWVLCNRLKRFSQVLVRS